IVNVRLWLGPTWVGSAGRLRNWNAFCVSARPMLTSDAGLPPVFSIVNCAELVCVIAVVGKVKVPWSAIGKSVPPMRYENTSEDAAAATPERGNRATPFTSSVAEIFPANCGANVTPNESESPAFRSCGSGGRSVTLNEPVGSVTPTLTNENGPVPELLKVNFADTDWPTELLGKAAVLPEKIGLLVEPTW